MMLLVLAALAGAAPAWDWVQEFTLPPTGGPPDSPCEVRGKAETPGVTVPPTTSAAPDEPEPPPLTTDGMVPFDLAPGALNAQLPSELAERLQMGRPYDLAAVPVEPLRGDPSDLVRVRRLFAEAGRGERTVRLSFWGASHVAGEYFTGELRRILQTQGGDAGHGFVMPAAPWKGYRATDVNLCTGGTWVSDFDRRAGGRGDGALGIGGMSVEASAPESVGWVQTTKSNPHGRAVSRFEVLYYRQPSGGTLDLVVDDAPAVRVSTRGAPGPGVAVLHVPDGPHRLQLSPAGDGPVRLFGVNMERDRPGVVVDAMGVSGRTASSWLRWDPELMAGFLARRSPDLAVLAYGTNEANDPRLTEATYRDTLRSVLDRMRSLLPDAACVLIGPSDRGKKVSGTWHVIWGPTSMVARVQREIAPEYGCVTWNLQEATGGPGSVFRWRLFEPPLMAGDLIHFSAEGYKELARRFISATQGA